MPAIVVPDLRRKFALLRAYPPGKTWPELAELFQRSVKAVQTWQDGGTTGGPDRMPDWAVPILTRLIGEVLPGERSPDEIRQFVFGPAAALEEEVRTGAAASLIEILTSEARRDTGTLVRRGTSIELVEVETEDLAPCPRLRLGEFFRIAFRRRLSSGYAVALQHAQRAWTLLDAAPSPCAPAAVLVPGVKATGEPRIMRERRDPGRHLFACLETLAPPPAYVLAHARDGTVLDKRALDALATFYKAQPEPKRACHLLTVEIEGSERT